MSALAYQAYETSRSEIAQHNRDIVANRNTFGTPDSRAEMSRQIGIAESVLSGRAYDIAQPNPHIPWHAYSSLDANDEIAMGMTRARQLVRDVIRNDALAKHAVRLWVGTIWGRGITPRADSRNENPDLKQDIDLRVQRQFDRHCGTPKIHINGLMSYYQMIEQGLRTVCSDGEFIIVRHQRNEAYVRRWNLDLPFQYETVEPEMLATHVRTWPGRGGAKYDVVNGIVLDKNGNRLGYLFLEKHPSKGGREVRFIDAEFIIHFFEVERAGQQRGISAFVGGVQTLYDLGDLSDATLKSAKMSAALMLILGVVPDAKPEDVQVGHSDAAWSDDVYAAGEIPGREPAYTLPSGNTIEDVHGRKMERLQAGGVARVAKGTDVNKIEPDSAGGFEAFEKSGIRRFAAGPGVHFESLSQNWTDSNYASFRGSMIPVRRDAQHWRDMLVERVIDILWQDVIVGGYIMNAWGFDGYWSPDEITQEERIMIMPPEETVDPEKDARANQAMLDSGEMDLEELLIRKGTTLDERFRSISKQRALAKKHGVEDWLDERLARNYKGAKGADVAATQEDATQ